MKRWARSVRAYIWPEGEVLEAPGFPVEIYNILGAGDAFGAGFIYGFVNDWGWQRSARLGNACGAIVVLAHGCANFMPTYDEVMAFVEERGGLVTLTHLWVYVLSALLLGLQDLRVRIAQANDCRSGQGFYENNFGVKDHHDKDLQESPIGKWH